LLTSAPHPSARPGQRSLTASADPGEEAGPDVVADDVDVEPEIPAERPRRKKRPRSQAGPWVALVVVLLAFVMLVGCLIAISRLLLGGGTSPGPAPANPPPANPPPVVEVAPRPQGKIDLADWIGQCSNNREWEERPLGFMSHKLHDGILTLTNDSGIDKWAGIATRRQFTGDYTIRAEVRNAKSLGLRSPTNSHTWAGVDLPPSVEWRVVVITRKQGVVSVTVDGQPVRYFDENSRTGLDRAIFYLHIWADMTADIRLFAVEMG
jgi:hypothetical protein